MPRKIVIPIDAANPLNLTDGERKLCMDLLSSMERSVEKERKAMSKRLSESYHRYGNYKAWSVEDERKLRQRVYRAAYNQVTGRQKKSTGLFTMNRDVTVDELDYVRQSLGMS